MRPTLRPDGLPEHAALWLNLAPVPAVEAMFGMATSRVVMAGHTLGIFRELSRSPASVDDLAERLGLNAAGTRSLLDCLRALGHVEWKRGQYAITLRARRWLDPSSSGYIGGFLEFNYDQWAWWSELEGIVRTGNACGIHAAPADDPYWRRYITAMYELARLVAPEAATKLRLPPLPKRILDIGGGHGWFSAELCRRHADLRATVLDTPGSARVGRDIIAEAGMADRVGFVEGDFLTCELGGPYDVALLFQVIHHLTPEQNLDLLKRARAALKPQGILALLDYFEPPPARRPDAAAFLGLHFYLTSGARTYTAGNVAGWLRAAGFGRIRRIRLRRLPIQLLLEARG